jgi:hypothetical protein
MDLKNSYQILEKDKYTLRPIIRAHRDNKELNIFRKNRFCCYVNSQSKPDDSINKHEQRDNIQIKIKIIDLFKEGRRTEYLKNSVFLSEICIQKSFLSDIKKYFAQLQSIKNDNDVI